MAAVDGAHMMMQCPRCSTRWRVAAASPVENPLFKCGRCHHLFRQFPGAAPVAESSASESRRTAATEPDTLEFIFPERQPAALLLAESAVPPVASADASEATLTLDASPPMVAETDETTVLADRSEIGMVAAAPARPDDDFSFAEDTAVDDGALEEPEMPEDVLSEPAPDMHFLAEPAESRPSAHADDHGAHDHDADDTQDDDEFDNGIDTGEILDEEPYGSSRTLRLEDTTMKASAGFGTIVRMLGTAVAGFAVLALVLRADPERTGAWLSRLPLAGATFTHDRNLARKVELRNVHGNFQRLRNARRVFVIAGEARNNSPVTIERIEVAGVLYGLGGGELDQRVVTTGNRTTLTDLSEAEIVLLQNLDPAIALAPGETTPFLIVFLEPPRELREFSSRVLTVRPTRQASTPPRPAGSSRDPVG